MGIGFLMKYKRGTSEWIDHLLNYGAKLTRRIAEAEARGDAKTINSLIRKKNQVNRWRRLLYLTMKDQKDCRESAFLINLWEEDGYQKKRETGNRERVAGLIAALRAQAASLVIFDPLRHFHSLNELNVDHVAHLFEVFRAIGRAVPCGVMIVHHHRKTARSQVEYEGAEDMSGSGALFGEADSIVSIYKKVRHSDDTRRYKMVFDLRHAETPEPMELFRMGGENAMLWTAEPWTDTPSGQTDETLDRILAVLSKDRMARYKVKAIEDIVGIKRSTLYGKLNQLVRSGRIKKDGNLYYVSDEE